MVGPKPRYINSGATARFGYMWFYALPELEPELQGELRDLTRAGGYYGFHPPSPQQNSKNSHLLLKYCNCPAH